MSVRLLDFVGEGVILVPVGLGDREVSLDDAGQDFVGCVGSVYDFDPISGLDAQDEVALGGGIGSSHDLGLFAVVVDLGGAGTRSGPRMRRAHGSRPNGRACFLASMRIHFHSIIGRIPKPVNALFSLSFCETGLYTHASFQITQEN